MQQQPLQNKQLPRIRVYILVMIIGLTLSGLTAFPIQTELALVTQAHPAGPAGIWLTRIYIAVCKTNAAYPFLSYGTDWLAFAHLVLAILFIGPLRDPVKNKWVIQFGIMAAILIFPLAFIAGNIRSIPLFWRLIDCSFGIVALLVLVPCYRLIQQLENRQ